MNHQITTIMKTLPKLKPTIDKNLLKASTDKYNVVTDQKDRDKMLVQLQQNMKAWEGQLSYYRENIENIDSIQREVMEELIIKINTAKKFLSNIVKLYPSPTNNIHSQHGH